MKRENRMMLLAFVGLVASLAVAVWAFGNIVQALLNIQALLNDLNP